MNNSYITIIKEKRTDLSRKRIPLNQNKCTADFRMSVPFEQNLHPGMDWNKEEFEENKKLARITVFVELLVVIALTYLGMAEKYILFMSFGMILCAILLTLGKITGQEVKCDE